MILRLDFDFQRRSVSHKRWCHHPQIYTGLASGSKNGVSHDSLYCWWCADPFPLQLVDLSAAQDVEAGDGTTSVVVLAGSFLGAAEKMLGKGTPFLSLEGVQP